MMPRQPQFQRSGRYQNALTDWAKGLADSGVAVTVAFGSGRGAVVTCPSERNAEEIVRKGIKRLNTTAYGNMVKRKGYSIGAVTAFEGQADLSASTPTSPLSRRQICRLRSSAGSWTEPLSVQSGLSSAHTSKSAGAKTGLTTR